MAVHKSKIENFNNDLWGHHFKVDEDMGSNYVDGNNRRVICTINDEISFPCALMPYGEGGFFINLNKEIRTKLNLKEGRTITFTLEKDNSKYGIPMPEEMEELLNIDDEASHYFHKLTPGKQRSLLYIIGKPKSSAIRLNKAVAITNYLKDFKGELDFKIMNTYIKEINKL